MPDDQKPYHQKKIESDSKIIKFKHVPKNQCLYCTRQLSSGMIVASCGPNNSAMLFEYDCFKIEKVLYNETFEVIYAMTEVEGFLVTGHSKGLLMIWDYGLGERVLKHECEVKDPITAIVYMKNALLWVSFMNGDMLLLAINPLSFSLDQKNQTAVMAPAKKIYSLSRLSDGRVCVSQDKGFSVWQVVAVAKEGGEAADQHKMQQQKHSYLVEETVSQVLEQEIGQVVLSTMSCHYYLFSLKAGQALKKIRGPGKFAIDLIRVPFYEQMGVKSVFCGVENECYLLIDFESEKLKIIQNERAENQSPWYTGAIFIRNKFRPECMVVAEEKKRSIRSFQVSLN